MAKIKISGVYKITNTITNDFYIGSSKNIERRWANHKCISTWNKCPNNQLYLDMQKYDVNNFKFEIIEETAKLKEREQYWISQLKPKYNNKRAKGWDKEKIKKSLKRYYDVHREAIIAYNKEYDKSHYDKRSVYRKEYYSRLCLFEGETPTLKTLKSRFQRQGIPHPVLEAKKYLIENN